jgi:hypothetical protein
MPDADELTKIALKSLEKQNIEVKKATYDILQPLSIFYYFLLWVNTLREAAVIFIQLVHNSTDNFFGLRDFFSFAKQLDSKIRSSVLVHAIEREFGKYHNSLRGFLKPNSNQTTQVGPKIWNYMK